MRVVVTRGAGFIGSHTVERLVALGQPVLVLDDFSSGEHADLARLANRIALQRLDIRDREGCHAALHRFQADAVVHFAAVASPLLSIQQPEVSHDVNVTGTFNLLEAARGWGARRFNFPGSAAVYGLMPDLPSDERDLVAPVSPYAAQKLSGELLAAVWRHVWGLETVSLRLFNVFGERQHTGSAYSGVISRFVAVLRGGGVDTILGNGEQTRGFVYVSDVVRVIERARFGPDLGAGPYNVGRGKTTSGRRLHSLLAARLGVPDQPRFEAERRDDVRHSVACTQRLGAALGLLPEVTVEEGIDRLLART